MTWYHIERTFKSCKCSQALARLAARIYCIVNGVTWLDGSTLFKRKSQLSLYTNRGFRQYNLHTIKFCYNLTRDLLDYLTNGNNKRRNISEWGRKYFHSILYRWPLVTWKLLVKGLILQSFTIYFGKFCSISDQFVNFTNAR